jgi:hypothetical protein
VGISTAALEYSLYYLALLASPLIRAIIVRSGGVSSPAGLICRAQAVGPQHHMGATRTLIGVPTANFSCYHSITRPQQSTTQRFKDPAGPGTLGRSGTDAGTDEKSKSLVFTESGTVGRLKYPKAYPSSFLVTPLSTAG